MLSHQNKKTTATNTDSPIGLLAGWGKFPFAVAEALREAGHRVAGVGIIDHADPRLEELCDHFDWIGIGGIGKAIRHFRSWGVTRATMAGKVHKVLFYQPGWWLKHRPDWKTIRAFSPQLFFGSDDRRDDTLLRTVVAAFARDGITFEPPTDFAPELLVSAGQVAGKRLTNKQQGDVEFGWKIAKSMGGLDIGQSICIKDQTVLAVEAIEGTDLCIRRTGELCTTGGFTVVKVAKPQQDMRFDVPTVGIQTLETMAAAGGEVLAIEADRTIVLDLQEFTAEAKRLKIAVVAFNESAARAVA
ncbi:MAG: LpxI family protein [Planctomycetes bacterium]|nr:LpxI family protein [Planctomycetota bacterium]